MLLALGDELVACDPAGVQRRTGHDHPCLDSAGGAGVEDGPSASYDQQTTDLDQVIVDSRTVVVGHPSLAATRSAVEPNQMDAIQRLAVEIEPVCGGRGAMAGSEASPELVQH